jgi:hypothetical protein
MDIWLIINRNRDRTNILHSKALQKLKEFAVKTYKEYKIAMNKLNMEFDLRNSANLEIKSIEELKTKANDDFKFEQEDHGSTRQDDQDQGRIYTTLGLGKCLTMDSDILQKFNSIC